ncbi:MAG: hypothetical protein KDC95_19335 [Planctomycetes bacterium]|nr:hypothetical protein [Planctomycetota bacterium]
MRNPLSVRERAFAFASVWIVACLAACQGPSVRSVPERDRSGANGERSRPAARPTAASRTNVSFPGRTPELEPPVARGMNFGSLFAPAGGSAEASADRDGTEGDVVFREGTTVVRKQHVYDRMLEVDPRRVQDIAEALRLDVRIRELSQRWDVQASDAEVDLSVRRELARMQRDFEKAGGFVDFATYVEAGFGRTLEDLTQHLRVLAWRRSTRSYVIRYAARRRGVLRLQRFLATTKEDADRVHAEVAQGGDLARLAEARSVGSRARFGGRLPPLAASSRHSATRLADGVEVGALGPVLAVTLEDGSDGFGFVRVLERIDPDPRPFADVHEELRRELERRPVERDEIVAFGASAFDS